MARRPVDASPEVIADAIKAAGDEVVLVGGQALALWLAHFKIGGARHPFARRETQPANPAITRDIDFLAVSAGDCATVRRIAKALGDPWFPPSRGLTVLVGQIQVDVAADTYVNVDVIHALEGFDTANTVRRRSVLVEEAGLKLRVMHPLDLLRSRMVNLHVFPEKQDARGVLQAQLSVLVAREHLRAARSVLDADESKPAKRDPLMNQISTVIAIAEDKSAKFVADTWSIHAADALDPRLIHSEAFWANQAARVQPLLSPQRAADWADYAAQRHVMPTHGAPPATRQRGSLEALRAPDADKRVDEFVRQLTEAAAALPPGAGGSLEKLFSYVRSNQPEALRAFLRTNPRGLNTLQKSLARVVRQPPVVARAPVRGRDR